MHNCPIEPCAFDVDDAQLMCPTHWAMVPKMLQRELYRAWDRGAGAGSEHHGEAMAACITVVTERINPPKQAPLFDSESLPAAVPPGYDTATCGTASRPGCGALMMWAVQVDGYGHAKTHDDGPRRGKPKKIPLNLRPHPDGHWRLIGGGRAQIIARGELVPARERYQAHHATCPEVKSFRARKQLQVLPGGRA